MIDFRYHIVSLIAVFLALAVGVVLGAGPLRGSLGEQLTVQIEQLREEREELRVALEEEESRREDMEVFIDAAATQLVAGVLVDVDVAVVEMEGVDAEVVEAVLERVEQGGGEVVGRVALSPRWTDPADAAVRDDLAAELAGALLIPPPADATTSQILGHALGRSLTERDMVSTESFSAGAQETYAALLGAELVTELDQPTVPAQTVLVLAPAPLAEDADPDAAAAVLQIEVDTMSGLLERQAVLAGTDTGPTDLVNAVRADGDAAEAVSTADGVDQVTGQVTVPLALAAAVRGAGVGHYGLSEGATEVLPTVPAPREPDGTEPDTAEPTGDDTATSDEETA